MGSRVSKAVRQSRACDAKATTTQRHHGNSNRPRQDLDLHEKTTSPVNDLQTTTTIATTSHYVLEGATTDDFAMEERDKTIHMDDTSRSSNGVVETTHTQEEVDKMLPTAPTFLPNQDSTMGTQTDIQPFSSYRNSGNAHIPHQSPPPPPPPPGNASLPLPDVPQGQRRRKEISLIECNSCCENFSQDQEYSAVIYPCARCKSAYCTKCVKGMFVAACKDVCRMPPRCCTQLQLHVARPYLTEAEAADFRIKYEIWSTPSPFYCPVPRCSTFISPRILQRSRHAAKGNQRIDSGIGTPISASIECPTCHTGICTDCRELSHPGSSCRELDFGVDEETAELLKSFGYKRCPKCHNGVRKMYGCNHIRCHCGAHWCWYCQEGIEHCDGYCYRSETEEEDDDDEMMDIDSEETAEEPIESADNTIGGPPTPGAPTPYTVDPPEDGTEALHILANAALHIPQTAAQPAPPENLDGRPQAYWRRDEFDFGDEPEYDMSSQGWSCRHRFTLVRIEFAASLRMQAPMECTKCWNHIHPKTVMPPKLKLDSGISTMVPGTHRGPVSRRDGGRATGRAMPRRELARGNASLGTSLSQSLPPSLPGSQSMSSREVCSNNGTRVVDTYGNVITTTDFIFKPDLPRRASFDIDIEHTSKRTKLDEAAAASQAVIKVAKKIDDASRGLKNIFNTPSFEEDFTATQPPFSMAYECTRCAVHVCESCKEGIEEDQRAQYESEEMESVISV